MRIVLDARTVTHHFPGIGRYTFNLAQALVPFLCPEEELLLLYDPTQASPWNLSSLRGVRLVETPISPFSLPRQWLLPRLLRQLKADIYHNPYHFMPYKPGIPTLITLHDVIPLRYPGYFSFRQRLVFKVVVRLATKIASKTIAVSEATAHDIAQYLPLPAARVIVIPEAADPAFEPCAGEVILSLRRRLNLPEQYVLYLGSNKPHKNLVRLVEAWLQIQPQPLPLLIAGVWDRRYPEAQEKVEMRQAKQYVRFLGPVAEEDLPALYSGAEVFVFPSEYEGFGLPVLEAMACGTPVACTQSSSVPEVAGEAALGFDPLNIEDISHKLKLLLDDAGLRSRLRELGLQQAARFSWERTAQETLAVYRQL
jgi:alpha-1,3-rhamnosyl/mannosyltransferase